jgi:hypothetical protein
MMGLPRRPYVSTLYEGVARMQMAGMRPELIPVTQSGSGTSRLGGGGNVDPVVRMNHGDIQQGGTMGRGKGHLIVSMRPLTAHRGNANGSVTGLRMRIAARAGGDAALMESSGLHLPNNCNIVSSTGQEAKVTRKKRGSNTKPKGQEHNTWLREHLQGLFRRSHVIGANDGLQTFF